MRPPATDTDTHADVVPGAGLCNRCRHQQIVRTTRGSVFSLCRRSRTSPSASRAIPGCRSSAARV